VIVLVTGGSSGIGHSIVWRLSRGGHEVFCASRDPERTPLPAGVTPVVLDVASADSARAAIDTVVARAGGLDALVNNAGVGSLGPIEETSEDEARHVFEVNFHGPLRLARLTIPVMRSRGGGRIVNVTSMNDVLPAPFGGFYSASKAALTSASYVLGAEVAVFGIRVTVVAPGLFRTAMADELGRRRIDPASHYLTALESLKGADAERLGAAGDPDDVAVAVEECLLSGEPAARIVVGANAEGFARLLKDASADDLARMLRDYVAQMGAPVSTPGPSARER
jgi:NAD(P)-dependent dehydrogenase (short-subunit alcohol dehydrogenase family)